MPFAKVLLRFVLSHFVLVQVVRMVTVVLLGICRNSNLAEYNSALYGD